MQLRTNFVDLFGVNALPFLDDIFYGRLKRKPSQIPQLLRVMNSKREMEQTGELVGMGLATVIPENSPMRYDRMLPGFKKNYIHLKYGLGFQVSWELRQDERWGVVAAMAQELGDSIFETRELLAISPYNNAFDGTNYPGPDGKALIATDHPLMRGGTVSNRLAVDSDLDAASFELALILMRRMANSSGKVRGIAAKTLIVPPELERMASALVFSDKDVGSANNDANWLRNRIGEPNFREVLISSRLTDTDAWFVRSELEDTQLRWYDRMKPMTLHEVDFDTQGTKTASWMRCSYGWSSHYGIVGSPGA